MCDVPCDRIHIRDLRLRCALGVRPEERRQKQEVRLNITLYADLRTPGRTDRLDDTVDYSALTKRVAATVEESAWFLIERLATDVADCCLEDPRVRRVAVTVDKPSAVPEARSVAVEILRTQHGG